MNKTEFVALIAEKVDSSKKDAGEFVDAFIESVTERLAIGDAIVFPGFGKFEVKLRSERTGRNPQTGEAMVIKAARLPNFKAGSSLKESVNVAETA